MIVVKVELWPFGSESRKQEIGRMVITNDGSGTPQRGNYNVRVMRKGSQATVQRTARVEDFPRRSYSVWKLIQKALHGAYDDASQAGAKEAS